MGLPRIELGYHRCKRCVLPLDYKPLNLAKILSLYKSYDKYYYLGKIYPFFFLSQLIKYNIPIKKVIPEICRAHAK